VAAVGQQVVRKSPAAAPVQQLLLAGNAAGRHTLFQTLFHGSAGYEARYDLISRWAAAAALLADDTLVPSRLLGLPHPIYSADAQDFYSMNSPAIQQPPPPRPRPSPVQLTPLAVRRQHVCQRSTRAPRTGLTTRGPPPPTRHLHRPCRRCCCLCPCSSPCPCCRPATTAATTTSCRCCQQLR
jgi:hypothetical protein